MKFTTATIAILATAVSAQSIADLTAQIPSCAQTCLATAITGAGCTISDNACQCGSANAAITKAATPCVISGCSSDDALKTQTLTSQICALVASGAGGSSGGSSSAASQASSAATSAASSASSAASSASESVTSAASSAASSASSAASSANSAASSLSSVASSASAAASSVSDFLHQVHVFFSI
ncbi:hypothetical protein ONS95_003644 [Cadophora gregata]|uniref:uncharacterized protein n=1 Tax=Cadophora gregata TaxID=51156 RepID=UPI0026DCCBB3|nr:uncharacterized protein ONS95_003644 [Cadophora gregata]KAK0106928.1 hypothetical protein ONS95_003644 [Cadophora gregata]